MEKNCISSKGRTEYNESIIVVGRQWMRERKKTKNKNRGGSGSETEAEEECAAV